jgi:hypothetical protein
MEGYASYSDAGSADAAPVWQPLPDAAGPVRDSGDRPSGHDEPDGQAPQPTSDGAITPVMDAGAGDANGGSDSGSENTDGASALDAPAGDGSNSSLGDARAGDTGSEAGTAAGGCTGQTACAPQCNTSPCTLDCADAGTCDVTCQAGQVCDIVCANAGTCNVTCRAGARCSTLCTNIQFCPVVCEQGANCRNSCTTGGGCGFSSCAVDIKECGLGAACGDDASC